MTSLRVPEDPTRTPPVPAERDLAERWAEFGRLVAAGHRQMPVPETGLAPFCHRGRHATNCRELRLLVERGLR